MRNRPAVVVTAALACAVASATPGAAAAQRADELPAGARVRVSTPQYDPIVGTVVDARGDSLVLRVREQNFPPRKAFAYAIVQRIEVSRSRRQNRMQGALIGLAGGALGGALFGAVSYTKPSCRPDSFICPDFGRGFAATAGALVLGGVGLVVGALVGRPTDVWQPVSPPAPPTRPPADGAAAGQPAAPPP
jgi:hypothetical protein